MEKMSSNKLSCMDLIYWSIRSSIRRGKDEVKRLEGDIVILTSCEFHFMIVHPNNNISITLTYPQAMMQ